MDEKLLRHAMSRLLRRHGYEVSTPGTGEDALAVMKERGNEFDLVLLDLGMPGLGGKACLLELIDAADGRSLVRSGHPWRVARPRHGVSSCPRSRSCPAAELPSCRGVANDAVGWPARGPPGDPRAA